MILNAARKSIFLSNDATNYVILRMQLINEHTLK